MAELVSPAVIGDTSVTSTSAQNAIGLRAYDKSGNEFVYVKAGAAIAQYDAVRFAGSALGFDDVRPTSATGQVVLGAAQVAIASASYGWIQTKGIATAKVVVSTAAGSSLVTNATAGTLALAQATDIAYRPAVALVTGVAAGSAVALV